MAPVMAAVLADRGDSALVFRGDDGLDELTTTTTSSVWVVAPGRVDETVVQPEALGIAPVPPQALRGGDRVVNAAVVRDVVRGGGGPVRDAVLLNAAAGIVAYDGLDRSDGPAAPGGEALAARLADGLEVAAAAIEGGAAADLLDRWIAFSAAAR
jgi:anthranilate phosphoribosyltransferase